MTSFILWCVSTYGLTFFLKDSELFSSLRERVVLANSFFAGLFSCAYCLGFYTGIISFLLLGPEVATSWYYFRSVLAHGFAGVAVSGMLEALALRLEGHG